MAALIPDERCFVLVYFLANENETGYIQEQCSHLQGDGASLKRISCQLGVPVTLKFSNLTFAADCDYLMLIVAPGSLAMSNNISM